MVIGVCRRACSRLLIEIDVGERLPVGVADDEAGVRLFGGPRRREAALGLFYRQDKNGLTELGGGARRNMPALTVPSAFPTGWALCLSGPVSASFSSSEAARQAADRLLGLSI